MSARAVMIQGTAPDAGKSVVVAGLCRAAKRRDIGVAPFEPQNMSNNAVACGDGGEIGPVQAVQARAAGLEPQTDSNPVLLKPQTDRGSQVILHVRPVGMLHASDYRSGRARLMKAVVESFARLVAEFDLVIVEGAGSPAEVNLRAGESPRWASRGGWRFRSSLVGDIDRGGVIAADGGHRRRAGRGEPCSDRGLPDQQAAGRSGAIRGRGAHHLSGAPAGPVSG